MVVWYGGMVYHMVAVDHQFFVAEKFKLSPGIVKALVTTNHCTKSKANLFYFHTIIAGLISTSVSG